MSSERIFNIISIYNPRATAHLIRQVLSLRAAICLDLEDSLWDVFAPERTPGIKILGRKNLIRIAEQFPDVFASGQLGLRINRLGSVEFERDLEALAQVSRIVPLGTLVVTKVESGQDLRGYLDAFSACGLRWRATVPIVETCAGIDHLDEIAAEAARLELQTIIYGHYDYSLDAGDWPFLNFDDPALWERITPFIAAIERYGLSYGHAPLLDLYDNALFARLYMELQKRCKLPFGIMTIGAQHTHLCARLLAGDAPPEPPAPLREAHYDFSEMRELAISTRDSFEVHLREGKGFALEAHTGRFISPHNYLAAIRFLEKNHE